MHDVTHDALVIAIVAGAVGAMIIGALASGLGLPADNQQPDVGRRRRRLTRFGLAGLGLGFVVVMALVLLSAGLASPQGTSLNAMLHKIGEGVERLQARWNAPAPQADSTSVRSVTLDPPVSPGPGSAQKRSPQVGDSRSVAAVPAAPVASISVPSVALDPPITVEPGPTKKTSPPAGASRSVAKTPAAPAASISAPGVALAPPVDLPPEALELSSWESLIASAQRAESAPPTPGASRPTTSSPPTPRASPPTTSSGPVTAPRPGRIGSSLAASIRTPPALPEVAIKRPERRDRDDDGKKGERRERNDREGKGRPERGDKGERVDKIERVAKVERVEKVERPQKVERVEKIERPQKIERVEKVERVQKVERREKVEKPERRGRN